MKPIVFDSAAIEELSEALAYYEQQRTGLGGEFRAQVEAALARILHNPPAYARDESSGARPCPLRRFPYTIYYVDLDDSIWGAAVAHHKRRFGYWARRMPPQN